MNETKNAKSTNEMKTHSSTLTEISQSLLNINIYKELDENPNQNIDLVAHIKNQLQQLQAIHQRKMFMIREIESVYKR